MSVRKVTSFIFVFSCQECLNNLCTRELPSLLGENNLKKRKKNEQGSRLDWHQKKNITTVYIHKVALRDDVTYSLGLYTKEI